MLKLIAEGHGETESLGILLRRIAGEYFGEWNPPIISLVGRYPAGRLIRKENGVWVPGPDVERASRNARSDGATGILILIDLDDECPKEVYGNVFPRLADHTGMDLSSMVFAKCEYEAWFLASVETLAENIPPYDGDPEEPRDCKGTLEEYLGLAFPYDERADQPRYTSKIDLNLVYKRCRSFRKLVKDVEVLLTGLGCSLDKWTPSGD